MAELKVLNQKISYFKIEDEDYISITDMLKSKDGDFFVSDWLRNRNTIEFLGIWEEIHNPNFNYGEFAIIKSQAGLNSYKISVKEWVEKTNAIGIMSKAGRYGGTYAHKDIKNDLECIYNFINENIEYRKKNYPEQSEMIYYYDNLMKI